jgi:hypothetical protein
MAGVFDILPGYLKMPNPADTDFKRYLDRITPKPAKPGPWESYNYWSNTNKFAVSFLKAMYGDAAKEENDWAFHYLPKIDRKYSWGEIWDDMYSGHIKGLLAFGMNGVAIGPNSQKNIDALKKADWLVVCEIYPGRDQRVLEISRHHARPDEADPHHGLSASRRGLRGKGRHLRQLRALAAMEERRRAATWLGEIGPGDPGADLPEGARTVSERGWQVPGPGA